MKLILAYSADMLLARGKGDDMNWTGQDDKRAFRLLTSVGGVLGAGNLTLANMPPRLRGRRIIRLTRTPNHTDSMTLDGFQSAHPNGWLIGGPRLARRALERGLVSEAHMISVHTFLLSEQQDKPEADYDASSLLELITEQASCVTPDIVTRIGSRTLHQVWRLR